MTVGKRQRPVPPRGRAVFASMSAIALLALACLPGLARAECVSSSCVQYKESIPNAEGEHAKPHHEETRASKSNTPHGGTNTPSQNGSGQGKGGSGGSPKEESSGSGTAPVGGGNGNGGGSQGSQGGSPNGSGKANPPKAGQQTLEPASESGSSGGSSPLVPILIAIAVLAAISVAVVMIRQRRQRQSPSGTPSPEAH